MVLNASLSSVPRYYSVQTLRVSTEHLLHVTEPLGGVRGISLIVADCPSEADVYYHRWWETGAKV